MSKPLKPLRLTKALITTHMNPVANKPLHSLRLRGILPGCRKEQDLTYCPFAAAVHVTPLYGYSGKALVSPEDWRKLCRSLEVKLDVTWRNDSKYHVEITPALVNEAREYYASFANSSDRQLAEAHPNFKPGPCNPVLLETA